MMKPADFSYYRMIMFGLAQRGDGVQRLNLTCQPWTITLIGHTEALIPGKRVQTRGTLVHGGGGGLRGVGLSQQNNKGAVLLHVQVR
jgi:hypothetical protein